MAKITDLRKNKVGQDIEVGDVVIGCSGTEYMVVQLGYGKYGLLKLSTACIFGPYIEESVEGALRKLDRDSSKTLIKANDVEVVFHG